MTRYSLLIFTCFNFKNSFISIQTLLFLMFLVVKRIDRFHVTSLGTKSKTKEKPKFVSISGIRGTKIISVYNFSAL